MRRCSRPCRPCRPRWFPSAAPPRGRASCRRPCSPADAPPRPSPASCAPCGASLAIMIDAGAAAGARVLDRLDRRVVKRSCRPCSPARRRPCCASAAPIASLGSFGLDACDSLMSESFSAASDIASLTSGVSDDDLAGALETLGEILELLALTAPSFSRSASRPRLASFAFCRSLACASFASRSRNSSAVSAVVAPRRVAALRLLEQLLDLFAQLGRQARGVGRRQPRRLPAAPAAGRRSHAGRRVRQPAARGPARRSPAAPSPPWRDGAEPAGTTAASPWPQPIGGAREVKVHPRCVGVGRCRRGRLRVAENQLALRSSPPSSARPSISTAVRRRWRDRGAST